LLDSTSGTTDAHGAVAAILQTSTAATVTAAVGAQAGSSTTPPAAGTPAAGTPTTGTATGTVTVNVAAAPTLIITPPATAPSAGLPSSYTFAVTVPATNGSAIRNVTVNWGDGGAPQDLGALTGTASVSHIYRSAGSYSITGTVTDSFGNVVRNSTSVTVTTTLLTLAITAPPTASAGLPAVFTFVPGVPAGDSVKNVRVDWGDNTSPQDLGAISASSNVSHVFDVAKSYTVTGTLTDTAGNSITVSTFVTVIPVASPTINITPSVPVTHSTTMTVSFQIQVSSPTGVSITDASINYGDGATDSLGGLNGTVTKTHPYTQPSGYSTIVTVTVKDSLGRTTQGTASITLP
jgi:hypothetical protein